MASPRTNFDAPSIAPKKLLSSSSVLRRLRASVSSIKPVDRSASIAICLPGMASKLKRAATSAMRPAPRVMTTKLTITRMPNTINPMTTLLPMMKPPKASMTRPAASVPSCPLARMSRVDARFSARRSIVAMSRMVGKTLNSRPRWMNRIVIRISTEKVIDSASEKSSSHGGIGRISTTRMSTTPRASAMSPRSRVLPIWPIVPAPAPAGVRVLSPPLGVTSVIAVA